LHFNQLFTSLQPLPTFCSFVIPCFVLLVSSMTWRFQSPFGMFLFSRHLRFHLLWKLYWIFSKLLLVFILVSWVILDQLVPKLWQIFQILLTWQYNRFLQFISKTLLKDSFFLQQSLLYHSQGPSFLECLVHNNQAIWFLWPMLVQRTL